MLSTLFTALGASPTPINFNEVYSALQTKLVEGQENPLAIIATARLYEVQKYCSLTNHVWDAYWILGNRKAVERLPKDIQEIVKREEADGKVKIHVAGFPALVQPGPFRDPRPPGRTFPPAS